MRKHHDCKHYEQPAVEFMIGHRCRAVFAKMVEAGEIVNSVAFVKWLSESVEEGEQRMRVAMKKDRKDDAKTAQIIRDVYRTCGDVKIDQVAKEFGHRCRSVFAKMVEAGEIVNSEKGWVVK